MEKKEKKKKLSKSFFKKIIFLYLKRKHSLKSIIFFKKNFEVNSFMLHETIFIHNGNVFRKLKILKFIYCMRLGIFVFTRKPFKYLLKKKKR